ncbi:MAG: GNAT family N-acetyltransferase [Acidimicrobiia bacterium]
MDVRGAEPQDLEAVADIAARAWWDTYAPLLKPDTIRAVLAHTYSDRAMHHRWEDHPMFLVVDPEDPIAFAEAFIEDERIVLGALYVRSGDRGRGAGSMLLEQVAHIDPSLPVTSDVLLGARSAEAFYEAHGFVPGETVKSFLYGEPIVERRWWKEPAAA